MNNLQLLSIVDNKYVYLGEGNCNIVLALEDAGLILRLRKSHESALKQHIPDSELKVLNLECEYYERIMTILIGKTFIQSPKIAELYRDELESLNDQLKAIRPISRQHKQLYCKYGTITIDYTSNKIFSSIRYPTLCVEIKCKQGWMPRSLKQYGKCTFCMNQYLKLEKKQISAISGYCPLDLFSGNTKRVRNALTELMVNPQNNFKVFLSGKQIFGENIAFSVFSSYLNEYLSEYTNDSMDTIDSFIDIIVEALLNKPLDADIVIHRFSKNMSDQRRSNDKQSCDSSWEGLPNGSVLKAILHAQMLEKGFTLEQPGTASDYTYLEELLAYFTKLIPSNPQCLNSLLEDLKPLHKYMLACSAKDCSVMIAIKPLTYITQELMNNHRVIKKSSNAFLTKIGVIDLDPKPSSKIRLHRKRDEDVVECYKNSLV